MAEKKGKKIKGNSFSSVQQWVIPKWFKEIKIKKNDSRNLLAFNDIDTEKKNKK